MVSLTESVRDRSGTVRIAATESLIYVYGTGVVVEPLDTDHERDAARWRVTTGPISTAA